MSTDQPSTPKIGTPPRYVSGHPRDLAQTEAILRANISDNPDSAQANYDLGSFLLEQDQPSAALPILQKAVKAESKVKFVIRLGECLEMTGDTKNALNCYRAAVTTRDNDPVLWTRYGNLLQISGQIDNAEDAYRSALRSDPSHHVATISLAKLLWPSKPKETLAVLDTALAEPKTDMVARVQLLFTQIVFKEWAARLAHGLMPYHATSLEEVFFHHAQSTLKELTETSGALVRQNPENAWARMTHALARFASGDYLGAQGNFSNLKDNHLSPMAMAIRFDEQFFEKLRARSNNQLTLGLPDVISVKTQEFDDADMLYMSCDASYFDAFARPLLRSLSDCEQGAQVHIHLMDSSPEHTANAAQFCADLRGVRTAVTVERPNLNKNDPGSARSYFHAIRFIRFYQHVLEYKQPLWLMDVDGLFNKSPKALFDQASETDIALRVRPGRLEPWNQFNACLFGVRPTERSLDYLRSVAHYIAHFYQEGNLPWGIDQLAMYACFIDAERRDDAPSLHFLDDKALDYTHLPDGILWCSSGSIKNTALDRNLKDDLDASPYQKAFMRYQQDFPSS